MTVIHFATLKPKPDIAPKRAAIVGIRQTTARKPSQLKKKAIILKQEFMKSRKIKEIFQHTKPLEMYNLYLYPYLNQIQTK